MALSLLQFSQKCLIDIDHDHFTFFDIKNGEKSSFSTYPQEWLKHYLAQKYHENDYVLLKNSFFPFAWGEKVSTNITSLQRQIFKEAQDFHIFQGITVPFSSTRSPGAITLSFSKREKLSQQKILKLGTELQFFCQMMVIYKDLLEKGNEAQEMAINLINELTTWQKGYQKQKKQHHAKIMDVLSDIRATQMFISHHETKDLGLETLHRAYKDIERLI